MKKILSNLNFLLLAAFSFGIIDLTGTRYSPYNYMPGWVFVLLITIWGSLTMYFQMAALPFFRSPKTRIISIVAVMSFALLVGLLIIHFVG